MKEREMKACTYRGK